MDTDRWRRISQLCHEALERPVDQREAFLDACCQGDEALRGEVASLLAHETSSKLFLGSPAAGVGGELEPGVELGTYRIERRLGRGGMGVVFLAYDATLRRKVALKVLASPTDEGTARARLLREARNAAALNHPNICTVYEVGEADGHAFIAMEYVDGRGGGSQENGEQTSNRHRIAPAWSMALWTGLGDSSCLRFFLGPLRPAGLQ